MPGRSLAATSYPASLLKEVVMLLGLFFAVVGCTLFGFFVGLFAFKVKSRWCPQCGSTTSAIVGRHQHVHVRH
jgi:hypothetical protein